MTDDGGDLIRVLHIDDDPSLTDLTVTFLQREDDRFSIETATNASDGLARLTDDSFDCIISDYDIPGQNGVEFLEAVREEHPDLPFILYTGTGSEEVASDAISAGVTDYLQKESGTDQYQILANRVRNVVERYWLEHEADHTRTQLQAIADNSADVILLIDAESRIHFANQRTEDHFGYTPSELHGEQVTTLMPERHREEHLTALTQYVETGERSLNRSHVEFPGLHRDGTEIPLSISFSEFEQDGKRRFICIMRNVSERVQMKEQLDEREERFRQVVENIREVVWMTDPDKREVLYVNSAYEDVWGRSVDALYDDPTSFLDAIHPEDRARVQAALETQVAGGYDQEYRIVRPDGERRWVHDRAVPVENDAGDVYRIVGVVSDITERKEQEQKRERIITRATDAIVEVNADWEFTLVNEQAEALYDMAESYLLGRNFWEVFHEARDTRFEAEYRQVMETRESTSFVEHFPQLDGWFDISAYPKDDGGIAFYFIDITEQRERQHELEQANTVLSTLFETLPLGVLAEDSDRNVLAVNDHLFELFELPGSPDEVEGADCEQLAERVSEMFVDSNRFVERTNDLVADREPADNEEVALRDGRTFERSYRPTELPDGDGHLWVYKDVTEQKEQRRRYEAVFNHTYQFTGLLELDGTVIEANDTVLEFGGGDREDVLGQKLWETHMFQHSAEIGERAKAAVERAANGEFVRHELLVQGADREAIVDFSVRPVTDEKGNVILLVPEGRDITERKERERAIQRERDRLDEFAGVVSHDLRNPLTVAKGRLELTQEECDSDHLAAIETAVDRIERITENVLWLAREGRDIGSMDAVVLHNTIETAWNIVADRAAHVELHYAGDEPSTVTVEADDDRLCQLLENLFRNAIEHGGEDVTVTVGAVDDGFYVEDDGPGIPEDRRDDVFTAGYSTGEDGTGFGLSIVKQVAEAHEWEIHVTEGTEGGARFEITGVEFVAE